MNRRTFLTLPGVAAAFASTPRPPNIVWIMGDDLGYGDLGCYGQKIIRTPNVDRLAAQGTRFTDAYAGCTVCAPSRSVLMTGKHTGHTPVRSNPGGTSIAAEDVTVAQVLKQAGYATGCFGKWGLGDINTPGVPWKHGFDEFFGFLHQMHAHFHYPVRLYHNDREVLLPGNANGGRGTYASDAMAGKALEFIRREKNRPFYCYLTPTVPHWEPLAPEDSMAPYRGLVKEGKPFAPNSDRLAHQPAPRTAYAAMVSRLDSYVGRVTALLEELNLERDTIVFFTSDNGGAMPAQDGEDYFSSAAGFRGRKGNLYEGGIRTPMIVRWPGRVAAGQVSNFAWMFQDFLPTAAAIAGVKPPRDIDGVSVVPALLGKRQKPHEFLYWELQNYDWNTMEFKKEIPMQAVRMGQWKAVRPKPDGPLELYNLSTDAGEKTNVASAQPAAMAKISSYLKVARTEPRPQKQPPHPWLKNV